MANNPLKNTLIAASIGTLVEWAEFCFYGYLAHEFSKLFFPMQAPGVGLLFAFGTFAIGYLARPLGGFLFGYVGDTYGRKGALSASILVMGLATLGIGLLPTYQSIGLFAPFLLMTLRFFQGIGMAGEFTGAAVMVIEQEKAHSYLPSSWISTTAALGMLIGGLSSMIISLPGMPDWAWRVPFLLGFLACILSFYMRMFLTETAAFAEMKETRVLENPLSILFREHKLGLIKVACLSAFVSVFFYTASVWWISFVIQQGLFAPWQARLLGSLMQFMVIIFTPIMAIIGDRIKSPLVLQCGILGNVSVVALLFLASVNQSVSAIILVGLLFGISHGAVAATMFRTLADHFPTQVRYSGQAIGWNLSAALFGGTAPMVAQYLYLQGSLQMLVYYVGSFGLLALGSMVGRGVGIWKVPSKEGVNEGHFGGP